MSGFLHGNSGSGSWQKLFYRYYFVHNSSENLQSNNTKRREHISLTVCSMCVHHYYYNMKLKKWIYQIILLRYVLLWIIMKRDVLLCLSSPSYHPYVHTHQHQYWEDFSVVWPGLAEIYHVFCFQFLIIHIICWYKDFLVYREGQTWRERVEEK